MRIHLGHHFYGAGNLGDDFMLAGFLAAMRQLAPAAEFSCCVPFPLEPLQQRFPAVRWLPYAEAVRTEAIHACDAWLGLGGSPFQSAQSRWFVDHLIGDAALCAAGRKPMFYLGVGVQTAEELAVPEIRQLCAQAAGIWTRDAASAARVRALDPSAKVSAAADLAHIFFSNTPPPPAAPGRVTLVPNFDFGAWPGQAACLHALDHLNEPAAGDSRLSQGGLPEPTTRSPLREKRDGELHRSDLDRVWLAQESRELPGAEHALYAALPPAEKLRWRLVSPEISGAPLADVLARWPSGEWLLTSRYHAAVAGAWAGSKIVVIATNEKLRGAATELRLPLITPEADLAAVLAALSAVRPVAPPVSLAQAASAACADFIRLASQPG